MWDSLFFQHPLFPHVRSFVVVMVLQQYLFSIRRAITTM
jgi:hypothetical protein